MKKRDKIALSIFAIFYITFGILITIKQESIVYHPNSQDFYDCPAFQAADKVTHNGTRMYVQSSNKPTVVLYHGNAGSACDRAFYTNMFTSAGYGYIVVEYAGYSAGKSQPSHELIKQDVQNVVNYLSENDITNVTVAGESIGTGAATHHASLQAPNKLILISPFTNLLDIAKSRFWFYPTSRLVDNAFDNGTALEAYENEILIIHGNEDNIIPYKLGDSLFSDLTVEKTLVTIDGAGHNNLFMYPETYQAITDFLTKK